VKRRAFITLLGRAAIVWPLGTRAQQPERVPRIGVLLFGGEADFTRFVEAFSIGMAERGYQDGKNIRFEVRHSEFDSERLALNARELVSANVELIWVPGSTTAQAAREATTVIPIVFATVSDPVASGFVRSLASPGTNMTGLSLLSSEMWAKRLELLFEVRAVGEPASSAQLPHIQNAAAALGLELLVVDANSTEAFPLAFGRFKEWRADALIFVENGLFVANCSSKRRPRTAGPR
jgi:ABC-type uncharacterized transport system substrate-binding protein